MARRRARYTKQLTLNLTEAMHTRLKAAEAKHDLAASIIAREAIEAGLPSVLAAINRERKRERNVMEQTDSRTPHNV